MSTIVPSASVACTDCRGTADSSGKIQHKPGCSIEYLRLPERSSEPGLAETFPRSKELFPKLVEPPPDHRLVINPTLWKILKERGDDMSQYVLNEMLSEGASWNPSKKPEIPLILTEGHRPGCICCTCERTRAQLRT